MLLTLLWLVPVAAHAQSKWDIGAIVAANTFDLATTKQSMDLGAHESNPMLGSSFGSITARKALYTSGLVFAAQWLKKSGHPKWAAFLVWGNVGGATFGGIHNLQVMGRK